MSLRVEDIGELAYGGLVVGAEQLDKQRMDKGEITDKDFMKKMSTYAYLVPGLVATGISAFGPRMMRNMEPWMEHISHGFIYDFPRFVTNTVNTMRETSGGGAKQKAVEEATRIMRESRAKALNAGREASRTYQQEFESVAPHAF